MGKAFVTGQSLQSVKLTFPKVGYVPSMMHSQNRHHT
jgi:hypothetical protein